MGGIATRQQIVFCLICLGIGLRAWHMLRLPDLWHDEAALLLNIVERPVSQMFGRLSHHEAAPPFFLVLERLVYDAGGTSLFALRFPAFLFSCIGLILFSQIAYRLLALQVVPWAVALFACSDRLLWHACEAKPYAGDCFLGVFTFWVYLQTTDWRFFRKMLLGMVLCPVMIWSSFPGCFLVGGLLAAWLLDWIKDKKRSDLLAWLLLAAVVAISFLMLVKGPAAAQRDGAMESCWTQHFPNWQKPIQAIGWSFLSTTEVLRYNVMPLGQLLFGVLCMGIYGWWQNGMRAELCLGLVPWLGCFVASCLHQYPYGGARIVAFLAPIVCLLIAAGIEPTKHLFRHWPNIWKVSLYVPLLCPICFGLLSILKPWPRLPMHQLQQTVYQSCPLDVPIYTALWEMEYLLQDRPVRPFHDIWQATDAKACLVLSGHDDDAMPIRTQLQVNWTIEQMVPIGTKSFILFVRKKGDSSLHEMERAR